MTEQVPTDDEREMLVALMQWMASLESAQETWEGRAMEVRPSAAGVAFVLQERSEAGMGGASGMLPDEVAEVVVTLQRTMADPEKGAWLTGFLSVTAEGEGDARFNFDEEPIDPETDEKAMTAADVRTHLERFPRSSEHTPEWMAAGGAGTTEEAGR